MGTSWLKRKTIGELLKSLFSPLFSFNPFTPETFTRDNPPIPWQFLAENKRTRAPKVNHMRSKTRDKLGNGLNPAAIFTGGYGRFREFGGCRIRAITGGSGANGLRSPRDNQAL